MPQINNPPFMNAYGLISKILPKIKEAKTPDSFTQDFLKTVLGFNTGSANAFIPLAKRLGLLNSDATPTELYKKFRNQKVSKEAMAQAIKIGYSDLFSANEYAYKLSNKELEGLIKQITGLDKSTTTLPSICKTFQALKEFADFEKGAEGLNEEEGKIKSENKKDETSLPTQEEDVRLNLSYSINLVLPKTEDISVFNAIFKSLKENLLRK